MSMPKKLERKLKRQAEEKGLTGNSKDAYVYGTLRKTGWTPKKRSTHNPDNNILNKAKLGNFIEERRKL